MAFFNRHLGGNDTVREKKNKIDLQEMNSQPQITLADILGVSMSIEGEPRDKKEAQTNKLPSDDYARLNVWLIRETKGRAGKIMTKMTGLPSDNAEILGLVRLVKRTLGCGVSVEDSAIFFQGDQRERLSTFLKSQGFEKVNVG